MKYKNIYAAIHNLGDSFLSSMNYVDENYVFEDICQIHDKGHEINIDWLNITFEPNAEATARILKSLRYYGEGLTDHFECLNVELCKLETLNFRWPKGKRKYMEATDDRGKYYKIFVREHK